MTATPTPLLEPGDAAPDFRLGSGHETPVSLRDFAGEPVVLAFFGDDWDPARDEHLHCYNTLLRELAPAASDAAASDRLLDVRRDGGSWCRAAFADATDMRLPLLRIGSNRQDIAEQYGVADRQAVFVVGGDGRIRWRFAAPAGVYPHPDAVRNALVSAREQTEEGQAGLTPCAPRARVPLPALTRRDFVATTLAAAFALALIPALPGESRAFAPRPQTDTEGERHGGPAAAGGAVPVTLNVNGQGHALRLDPRVTLLDALREYMGLTGTKKGCDHGQCGACTVLVNDRRVNSCMTLAIMNQNAKITTIEGLARGDTLHPMQEAFLYCDGFQCGYCTPGQIMSAVGLMHEGHAHSEADVREQMSGNICRCGAYPNIVAAVEEVRLGKSAHTALNVIHPISEEAAADASV